LRFGAPALFAILIKIDGLHRMLPFRDGHVHLSSAKYNRLYSKQK
jgi:hypothetical protein